MLNLNSHIVAGSIKFKVVKFYKIKKGQYSAYSLIRIRWARFFCKHVRITKVLDKYNKSIFSYNNITAAYNAVHNK